jgi:hypothetical protein
VPKSRAVGLLPVCLTVKPVGEPDALIGHVRFDERGWETERCRLAEATAPILDSTKADLPRCLLFGRFRRQSGHQPAITERRSSFRTSKRGSYIKASSIARVRGSASAPSSNSRAAACHCAPIARLSGIAVIM